MNEGETAFLCGEHEASWNCNLNFHMLSVGSWPIHLAYFCLRP